MISILKITKGHTLIETQSQATILFLCTFSDDALYLHQVS